MERRRYTDPADVGLTWASIRRQSEQERKLLDPLRFNQRGRLRLGRVGALLLSVLVLGGVAVSPAGPAVGDFIKGQVDSIIAKDNEVVRQTSQIYQTPEFKALIDRNLGR